MQLVVIINNDGVKIIEDANVKNSLIKGYGIKDLFGILVIVNVNVIKIVVSVNI